MEVPNGSYHRWCMVRECKNTSIRTKDKLFICVPKNRQRRHAWLLAAGRNLNDFSEKSTLFCCEDHFDLPNDMENYMKFKLFGRTKVLMKKDAIPHRFNLTNDQIIENNNQSLVNSPDKRGKNLKRSLIEEELKANDKQLQTFTRQINKSKKRFKSLIQSEYENQTTVNYLMNNRIDNLMKYEEVLIKSEESSTPSTGQNESVIRGFGLSENDSNSKLSDSLENLTMLINCNEDPLNVDNNSIQSVEERKQSDSKEMLTLPVKITYEDKEITKTFRLLKLVKQRFKKFDTNRERRQSMLKSLDDLLTKYRPLYANSTIITEILVEKK